MPMQCVYTVHGCQLKIQIHAIKLLTRLSRNFFGSSIPIFCPKFVTVQNVKVYMANCFYFAFATIAWYIFGGKKTKSVHLFIFALLQTNIQYNIRLKNSECLRKENQK